MDNKITKSRLMTFLTYDLWKMLIIIVAVCFLLLIVFNWVAVKPTAGQSFYVLCDNNIIIGDEGDKLPLKCVEKGAYNGGFSYDILSLKTYSLQTGSEPASYVLGNVVGIGDDDIFITGEELGREYLDSYNALDIVEFVQSGKDYCIDMGFYTESGEINESKVIENFNLTRGKDNRFRSEDNIKLGKEQEILRIKAIWENSNLLYDVFEEHPEIFSSKFTSFEWGDRTITGQFAIELSKLKGNDKTISNAFKRVIANEETGEVTYTSDGIYLFVGDNGNINGDLNYEALAYIRTIIEEYTDFI